MAKLPGLFAKLLGNYGDDIARVVANYGDDAARVVANYGDDVARGVVKYGDDAVRVVANNTDDIQRLASNYGDVGGDILKANADDPFTGAVKNSISPKNTNWLGGVRTSNPYWYDPYLPQTHQYKDIIYEPAGNYIVPKQGSNKVFSKTNPIPAVSVPNLNTDDLVLDTFNVPNPDWTFSDPIEDASFRVQSLRPHSNTALGRWFKKQMAKKV